MRTIIASLLLAGLTGAAAPGWAQPAAPEDRAAQSGMLTVYVNAGMSETMEVVASNGFPFDVLITSLMTENCVHIRPQDCGVVARNVMVPAGEKAPLYVVRRVDITRPSTFTTAFTWEAASAAKILDNSPR